MFFLVRVWCVFKGKVYNISSCVCEQTWQLLLTQQMKEL